MDSIRRLTNEHIGNGKSPTEFLQHSIVLAKMKLPSLAITFNSASDSIGWIGRCPLTRVTRGLPKREVDRATINWDASLCDPSYPDDKTAKAGSPPGLDVGAMIGKPRDQAASTSPSVDFDGVHQLGQRAGDVVHRTARRGLLDP